MTPAGTPTAATPHACDRLHPGKIAAIAAAVQAYLAAEAQTHAHSQATHSQGTPQPDGTDAALPGISAWRLTILTTTTSANAAPAFNTRRRSWTGRN